MNKNSKKYPPSHIILRKGGVYRGFITIERGNDESFYLKPYFYNKNIFEGLSTVDDNGNTKKINTTGNSLLGKVIDPYISIKKSGRIHINGFDQIGDKVPVENDFSSIGFQNIDGLLPVVEIVCAEFDKYKELGRRPQEFPFNWTEISSSHTYPHEDKLKAPSYVIFDLDSYLGIDENLIVSLFLTPSDYKDSVNSELVRKMSGYISAAHISNALASNDVLLVFRRVGKKGSSSHTIFMIQPFDLKIKAYKISH